MWSGIFNYFFLVGHKGPKTVQNQMPDGKINTIIITLCVIEVEKGPKKNGVQARFGQQTAISESMGPWSRATKLMVYVGLVSCSIGNMWSS